MLYYTQSGTNKKYYAITSEVGSMKIKKVGLLFVAFAFCIILVGCDKLFVSFGKTGSDPTIEDTPLSSDVLTTTTSELVSVNTESDLSENTTSQNSVMTGASALPEDKNDTLDPTYERLMLVNVNNPLAADFNNEDDLVEIESKYINGSLNQIDRYVYPYLKALMELSFMCALLIARMIYKNSCLITRLKK